jgi:sugar/nucleoside kinase (ribokinase family)
MRRNEIYCVGISVADVLGSPIREMPRPGTATIVDNLILATGGCALNTAIGLSRLGVKTGIFSRVGNDPFGHYLVEVLRKEKVDASSVRFDAKAATSFTYVAIFEDGERAFLHTIGANAKFRVTDIDFEKLSLAKIAHVAGVLVQPSFDGPPTVRFLKRCKKVGLLTSLDTVYNDKISDPAGLIAPCLPHTDFFMPSLNEAQRMSGLEDFREVARWCRSRGAHAVILKMGPEGAYLLSEKEEALVGAYRVKTVDGTGAGDAFASGFLAGILRGMNLVEATRLGSAVGALCVQAVGATAGIPTLRKVLDFQKRYRQSET